MTGADPDNGRASARLADLLAALGDLDRLRDSVHSELLLMLSVPGPESLLPARRLKLSSFLPAMRRTADHRRRR
jgi:hypothetical protein